MPYRGEGNEPSGNDERRMKSATSFRHVGQYEAHDLLRLRALPAADDMPTWLRHAFAQCPFAVVRRAEAPWGFVAVGFRGADRAQRYGAFAPSESVELVLRPEQLRDRPVSPERINLKAFAAFRALVEDAHFDTLAWGPTGSVGFELGTMRQTVTEASDLDIVIRTPAPLARERARALRERATRIERTFDVRIDAQLETPAGGVALSEWAASKPRVLARSAGGPRMTADPWRDDGAAPEDGR
jgi:phosphoribosyl-dephospho-CoA transferase